MVSSEETAGQMQGPKAIKRYMIILTGVDVSMTDSFPRVRLTLPRTVGAQVLASQSI